VTSDEQLKADRADAVRLAELAGWIRRTGPATRCAPDGQPGWAVYELPRREPATRRPRTSEFSLFELFSLVALAALVCAGFYWLPRDLFAGVVGVATLLGMRAVTPIESVRASVVIAWWLLLGVYLAAAAMAVLKV
jgi:hypothetical protein